MPTLSRRNNFLETEVGAWAKAELQAMANDPAYATEDTYSSNSERYPDNTISFVDKHINYLSLHPKVNPEHYVSNLKLMTRLR